MERVAVFVDAGYLFAQGSIQFCGTKLTRGEITLDHNAVTAKLKTFAEAISELPLLRIYWYDGTSQGPTSQHIPSFFSKKPMRPTSGRLLTLIFCSAVLDK